MTKIKIMKKELSGLIDAIANSDEDVINNLLKNNPLLISQIDSSGRCALEYAVDYGNVHIVKILLDSGARISNNDLDRFIDFVPQAYSYEEILKNPDIFNGNAVIFIQAISKGDVDIAKMLFEKLLHPTEDVHYILNEALYTAVREKKVNSVEFLIKIGADVNHTGRHGDSVLMMASAAGSLSIVKILLQAKAEIDFCASAVRFTPLMDAIRNGHSEVALFLIKNGAAVDTKASNKATPLSLAKKQKLKEVIEAIEGVLVIIEK